MYERLTRVEKLPYAREAIREGILNALMHNNYMSAQPIAIRVSPRELWISNMCIFPAGWTEETLFSVHESRQLNPNVAVGFFRAGMVERFGSGIRKILDYSKGNGNPKPHYTIYPEMVTLKMQSRPGNIELALGYDDAASVESGTNVTENVTENVTNIVTNSVTNQESLSTNLSKRQQEILLQISKNPSISTEEIAINLGITKRTVLRIITYLKENHFISRIGSNRSGHWIIEERQHQF